MMQRKNKAPHVTKTTITEDQLSPLIVERSLTKEKSDKNIASKLDISENSKEIAVATVVRRSCGTSPFDKNWLNVDCCGLFCASLTYGLHIYGCHAVCNILLPPWFSYKTEDSIRHISFWGYFHIVCFVAIALMAVISHFKAMTTDPGAVPPDASPIPDPAEEQDPELMKLPPRAPRLCRRCNSYKPPRAHHCSVCKRCIIKMDHHCPWVNNCVGIGNHKYFLLFIFYTFLSCTYAFSLLIIRMMVCMSNIQKKDSYCLDDPTDLLKLMGLGVESLLFGLFTSCMMVDQWDVVTTNLTHIDRLKGESYFMERRDGPTINEVFGIGGINEKIVEKYSTKFQAHWLSPFVKVLFPESINDQIMGFCRPCGIGKNLMSQRNKKNEDVEEIM